MIHVIVSAPVVPAYPGSAHNLLPAYTSTAATKPPSGVPIV